MRELQFKGTQGEFTPEKHPTPNPRARCFQIGILQIDAPPENVIPGFAFGRTVEECMANAHLFANAKQVLQALVNLMALHGADDQPEPAKWIEALKYCQEVTDRSLTQYKPTGK